MIREELDDIVARLRKGASDWFPQALELDLEKLVREAEKAQKVETKQACLRCGGTGILYWKDPKAEAGIAAGHCSDCEGTGRVVRS